MRVNVMCRAFIAPASAAILLLGPVSGLHAAPTAEPNSFIIKDFHFSPLSLTVPAGAMVVWKNLDGEPHTVVSIEGLFRSGGLDQNDSYTFKFDKPGTYKFVCSIHPQMLGTIIVK